MTLQGEESLISIVLFLKDFLLLKVTCGSSAEKEEATILEYMEIQARSDAVGKSLCFTCVMWSGTD